MTIYNMKKVYWVMLNGQRLTGPFTSEKKCDESTLRGRRQGYSTYSECIVTWNEKKGGKYK